MERVGGIDPPYLAWQASTLPLCYTRRKTATNAINFGQDEEIRTLNYWSRTSRVSRLTLHPEKW